MRAIAVLVVLAALGPLAASAAAIDETTSYLLNTAHTSSVPDSPLQPPLKRRWRAELGHVASNVIVTGGRVIYVRQPGTGLQLTALSTADGSTLWSQAAGSSTMLAADGGRLFVVSDASQDYPYSVHVRALDPGTGGEIWSRTISSEYGAGSHPTAANGQLFFLAASGGSSLHALRQSDGAALWPAKSLVSGDGSAPTLDGDSVYVSLPAHRTYAFRRADGTERWQSKGCCTGGGGMTPVVHKGLLYGYDGLIHQTSDGLIVGEWTTYPAWSGDQGVRLDGENLRGIGPDYGTTRWTVPAPSASYDAPHPIIAGQHVYVAGSGELWALRLEDGTRMWCTRPQLPAGSSDSSAIAPVAAGDGLLLVSEGYGLAAYESGGTSSSACTTTTGPPSGGGTTQPPLGFGGPALDIVVARDELLLGERTTVEGQLVGMPITAGQEVVAEVDEWPFEGTFLPAARDVASDGGFVAYRLEPERNVQVRLRLASDPSVASAVETVWTDFPLRIVRRGRGGPRPLVHATVHAPPGTQIRRRVVHGYLLRRGWSAWHRVAARRWQRLGRRSVSVTLRYPRGTLGRRDRVLLCTREPAPDGFGRPTPYDVLCGARRLPRS